MRRAEALAAVVFALAALVAGATWLAGPYGLLGAGAVVLLSVLFVFDVEG